MLPSRSITLAPELRAQDGLAAAEETWPSRAVETVLLASGNVTDEVEFGRVGQKPVCDIPFFARELAEPEGDFSRPVADIHGSRGKRRRTANCHVRADVAGQHVDLAHAGQGCLGIDQFEEFRGNAAEQHVRAEFAERRDRPADVALLVLKENALASASAGNPGDGIRNERNRAGLRVFARHQGVVDEDAIEAVEIQRFGQPPRDIQGAGREIGEALQRGDMVIDRRSRLARKGIKDQGSWLANHTGVTALGFRCVKATVVMVDVDKANAAYWDEPSGTTRLEHLDVPAAALDDPAALAAFDAFFWEFYPYLERLIPFGEMRGRDVLEVGLGMGSVSERIARAGARLTALDIAAGPVGVVNSRLRHAGLPGTARIGSILEAPFADDSFDFVVSLGCLHHTGDLPRAIREVHRILRPGGTAIVMLYYVYSPKRWALWPRATWRHLRASRRAPGQVVRATATERAGYDRSSAGGAPPETVFTSRRQMAAFCAGFRSVSISLENLDTDMLLYPLPRDARGPVRPRLLKLGRALGIATEDMYVTLRK